MSECVLRNQPQVCIVEATVPSIHRRRIVLPIIQLHTPYLWQASSLPNMGPGNGHSLYGVDKKGK